MKTYEELEIYRSTLVRKLQLHEFVLDSLKQDERRIASMKEDVERDVDQCKQKIREVDAEIREKLLPLYPEGFERGEADAS
ncbi:hypothetical protein HP398_29910 [Brevibacillus sp. HB1.4B]|uniref:hypothetical protein n=1 Tax=Brevibacillus sp. HB1.4B TaxID=2738845 RepID=UPI00156BA29C|nr:hypothetical protein [Brevibacillus sp. HB1.4B]NRS20639.1 hypothetical protein [Brevibacillus sp. HB1.4B]